MALSDINRPDFEKRLRDLGYDIPKVPPPMGLYVPAVRTGSLVFCSGQGPSVDGVLKYVGRIGDTLTQEDGYQAARIAALNCLAEIRSVIGSLNNIRRIVSLRGFVNSAPDFFDQPKVVNGASQLLLDVFGDAGRHARAALGTSILPSNIAVELEMVVEVAQE
jgi:enamine deaminase RidA (YjgF/YER057c/UK114 family)